MSNLKSRAREASDIISSRGTGSSDYSIGFRDIVSSGENLMERRGAPEERNVKSRILQKKQDEGNGFRSQPISSGFNTPPPTLRSHSTSASNSNRVDNTRGSQFDASSMDPTFNFNNSSSRISRPSPPMLQGQSYRSELDYYLPGPPNCLAPPPRGNRESLKYLNEQFNSEVLVEEGIHPDGSGYGLRIGMKVKEEEQDNFTANSDEVLNRYRYKSTHPASDYSEPHPISTESRASPERTTINFSRPTQRDQSEELDDYHQDTRYQPVRSTSLSTNPSPKMRNLSAFSPQSTFTSSPSSPEQPSHLGNGSGRSHSRISMNSISPNTSTGFPKKLISFFQKNKKVEMYDGHGSDRLHPNHDSKPSEDLAPTPIPVHSKSISAQIGGSTSLQALSFNQDDYTEKAKVVHDMDSLNSQFRKSNIRTDSPDNYSIYSLPPPAIMGQELSGSPATKGTKHLSISSTIKKVGKSAAAGVKRGKKDQDNVTDNLLIGINLHENGELEKAAEYFKKSSEECGMGMLLLGLCLQHGWGIEPNQSLGFQYLQKAAESVISNLNQLLIDGKVGEDVVVKNELVLSLYELGNAYRFGFGVQKDLNLSLQYLTLAANLGDIDAQKDLAFCLENGIGCKKSKESKKLAAKYYRLAIEQGGEIFGLSWVSKEKWL